MQQMSCGVDAGSMLIDIPSSVQNVPAPDPVSQSEAGAVVSWPIRGPELLATSAPQAR